VYGLAVNRKRDREEARRRVPHEDVPGEFGAGRSTDDLRRAGRRLTAYCMGRTFEEEYWLEINGLELFEGLREGGGLPRLQRRLRAKVDDEPCFRTSSAPAFCTAVDGFLAEVGWA
jgi:hypothetical protein